MKVQNFDLPREPDREPPTVSPFLLVPDNRVGQIAFLFKRLRWQELEDVAADMGVPANQIMAWANKTCPD